jgi:hypothetical protein
MATPGVAASMLLILAMIGLLRERYQSDPMLCCR